MKKSARIGLRLFFWVCLLNWCTGCGAIASTPPRLNSVPVNGGIVFDSAFDSGSLAAVEKLGGHRFLVRPRPDYGRDGVGRAHGWGARWNGRTWWYHFSIAVPEERLPCPIELHLDAFSAWSHRVYAADKVPVASCDGRKWRFVDDWSVGGGRSVISHTLTCPKTYMAMATPYPWTRMEKFILSISTSPYAIRHEVIGYTPLGGNQDALPLYYMLLGDPGGQQDKRNVVVISGQHPGETTNAWMLTGFLGFLLSDDAIARSLRQRFSFHIYPAVNPEGVKYGHYRRTADSPLNTNRAWNTREVLEIQNVRNHMMAQTKGRADYLFDLHGTSHPQHYLYHYVNARGVRQWVKALAARHPNVSDSLGKNWWRPSLGARSAIRWAMRHMRSHANRLEPPISFSVEGAYGQGSWAQTPDQAEDWKALGAALLKTIYDVEGMR